MQILPFSQEQTVQHMDQLVVLYKVYEEPPTLYKTDPAKDANHFKKVMARTDSVVFVALQETKVVGCLTGYPLEQEEKRHQVAFGGQYPPRTYHIKDLLVSPEHRHVGVATRMYRAFEDQIKKTGNFDQISVAATLRDGVRPSGEMWQKFGFISAGYSKSSWTLVGQEQPSEQTKQFWLKKL